MPLLEGVGPGCFIYKTPHTKASITNKTILAETFTSHCSTEKNFVPWSKAFFNRWLQRSRSGTRSKGCCTAIIIITIRRRKPLDLGFCKKIAEAKLSLHLTGSSQVETVVEQYYCSLPMYTGCDSIYQTKHPDLFYSNAWICLMNRDEPEEN